MDFGRLVTAMVTPFDASGAIDWTATGQLIDYLIDDQKSDSIVVSGTTGESPTLTDEEKKSLFTFAVEHAKGRCKIIAGTGSNDTNHSIHLTQAAERCGVDAILLVVPYYNKPTQEGIYQHFKAISESTQLPIILYNVPSRTVASMTAATTLRLAELPNIVATKECASLEQVTQIIAGSPEGFRLYSGDDSVTLPVLAVGGYGIVSVASHVVGAEMKQMIEAYLTGNVGEAAKLHVQLYPIFKELFELPNPVLVKAALGIRNVPVGSVRLPLVAATETEMTALREILS
ncbi:4-hydroxy-tetrahydrodipicolinate synthase [Paenibacillus baekrokdamisoli]|uniref:4-hydroxy-tetrahydrodipicolinate synthase n=1 Tax=Paenibacillus baekrokdamisoli TaxID=1712516 RepID=A0A3G9JBZ0_9BACL|nr:4-hydroxy-tetrahydrodipicolinate synthase [Paenibacillus baekrokdamisoli]MBB3069832.1 4-hydroxy-tetrahydrodipicolinate synthase [Paenibacillus baekrokdamisoli]BBH20814.1 4-hydroxy-tetrahydrodipicolinate synthase [Paenibacillus baekrokdamisoli]